jgi:hypothetical protein
VKEILYDALGEEADLAWSRRLGAAAMEMLWARAAYAPAAVLEANFWPDDPRHPVHAQALGLGPVVCVDTTQPVDIAALAVRVRAQLPVRTCS